MDHPTASNTTVIADMTAALMAAYQDIENTSSSIGKLRAEAETLQEHRMHIGARRHRAELIELARAIEMIEGWPDGSNRDSYESQFYEHAVRLRFIHDLPFPAITEALKTWLDVTKLPCPAVLLRGGSQ